MSVVTNDLEYGKVAKVDMIEKTDRNGEDYIMAFVHFESWADSKSVNEDREKLLKGEKIKVVYDEEKGAYFTLVKSYSKSREDRPTTGPRYASAHGGRKNSSKDGNQFKHRRQRVERPKPFIDDSGWTNMPVKKKETREVQKEIINTADEVPSEHKRNRQNHFATLAEDSEERD